MLLSLVTINIICESGGSKNHVPMSLLQTLQTQTSFFQSVTALGLKLSCNGRHSNTQGTFLSIPSVDGPNILTRLFALRSRTCCAASPGEPPQELSISLLIISSSRMPMIPNQSCGRVPAPYLPPTRL